MTVQKTDWGQIQWTNDKDDLISIEGLKVGMVTLNTGAHQERHIHFEEQVLYVVQGTAVSKVGKEQIEMKPGQYYHWPAGVLHEVWNTGDLPFRHLLVANANFEDEWLIQEDEEAGEQRSLSEREVQDQARQAGAKRLVSPDLIYGAVEAIRTQFLENIHYSYVIFDTAGNVVIQSERYPAYCNRCCRPQENSGSCPCMVRLTSEEKEEEQSFRCPFGMEVFHNPIRFHQTTIGYIQSGYIRHAYGEKDNVQSVYDVPESVVAGIRALIRRIVKAIRNYCEFEQFRRDLTERELRIATGEETRQILMKNLKDAEYAMTDLKINNHFLFNTLNSMASMAVECGAMPLYQSIVDLSKMFHYTQRTQSSMVVLTKEIEYVNAYLKLQKLRYGDSLQVQWEIDPRLENVSVPFNFLQPIVENAFVHGFKEVTDRRISIRGERQENRIRIEISNSGESMTDQICNVINRGLKAGVSHGLSMIYLKLQAVYGPDFALYAQPEAGGGTCFVVEFPLEMRKKERCDDTGGTM